MDHLALAGAAGRNHHDVADAHVFGHRDPEAVARILFVLDEISSSMRTMTGVSAGTVTSALADSLATSAGTCARLAAAQSHGDQ